MTAVIARIAVVASLILSASEPALAQRQQSSAPSLPVLSAEATAALDELSSRYATEFEFRQGWFRDRAVLYYDFGPIPEPPAARHVYWPIHGFDASGNPVAMRGQLPIFSTIPGLADYSGLWLLTYVVVADNVQPNHLRDASSVEALVRARRALLRETNTAFNLPIVPRGSRLARDSTPPDLGWYQGREVQFFDFGGAAMGAIPLITFFRGQDPAGEPEPLREQNNVVDSIPVAPPYADLWAIRYAHADSTYVPNSLKSATTVERSENVKVDSASSTRNCPIALVDGQRIQRVLSPLSVFADRRSPFPPAPTEPR